MPGKPIRSKLMEYATQRPGESLFVNTITHDLNEDEKRVRKGLSHIVWSLPNWGLERITPNMYRYIPQTAEPVQRKRKGVQPVEPVQLKQNPNPDKETVFSVVGPCQDGGLIIESDDGRLFKAVAL